MYILYQENDFNDIGVNRVNNDSGHNSTMAYYCDTLLYDYHNNVDKSNKATDALQNTFESCKASCTQQIMANFEVLPGNYHDEMTRVKQKLFFSAIYSAKIFTT